MEWLLVFVYLHSPGVTVKHWAKFETVQACALAAQQMADRTLPAGAGVVSVSCEKAA